MQNDGKFAVIIGEVIVNECLNKKIDINTSKLIKLLYYMQQLHLQKYGEPMFKDKIIATVSGPYIKDVGNYFNFGRLGFKNPFEKRIILMDSHEDVADNIIEQYGNYSPIELMNLSKEDYAYMTIWDNGKGNNQVIPLWILANNQKVLYKKKM